MIIMIHNTATHTTVGRRSDRGSCLSERLETKNENGNEFAEKESAIGVRVHHSLTIQPQLQSFALQLYIIIVIIIFRPGRRLYVCSDGLKLYLYIIMVLTRSCEIVQRSTFTRDNTCSGCYNARENRMKILFGPHSSRPQYNNNYCYINILYIIVTVISQSLLRFREQ